MENVNIDLMKEFSNIVEGWHQRCHHMRLRQRHQLTQIRQPKIFGLYIDHIEKIPTEQEIDLTENIT